MKNLKLILHLVPTQNLNFLFFDTGLLLPRIRAPLATFKAVLIAVDMPMALQVLTCFLGGSQNNSE